MSISRNRGGSGVAVVLILAVILIIAYFALKPTDAFTGMSAVEWTFHFTDGTTKTVRAGSIVPLTLDYNNKVLQSLDAALFVTPTFTGRLQSWAISGSVNVDCGRLAEQPLRPLGSSESISLSGSSNWTSGVAQRFWSKSYAVTFLESKLTLADDSRFITYYWHYNVVFTADFGDKQESKTAQGQYTIAFFYYKGSLTNLSVTVSLQPLV